MLYLERTLAPPLSEFVRVLWYARGQTVAHSRERVLPTGRVQVILNLARDFLLDCPEGEADRRMPPALVIGARSAYEIVDTSDMADLIGVVFEPGGFGLFAADAVDLFSNRSVDLEAIWGSPVRSLRDRMRELPTPELKLRCLEHFLGEWIAPRLTRHGPLRPPEVTFALQAFERTPGFATVRDVAKQTGWSERRFSQAFRESIGLSPKVWCRVQRFQRAVQQLHAGGEVRWAELVIDCGFYDQSHFANEFKAFSGIDATTYSAQRTQWANHIAMK
jgi:AraC-like DNA-binding protein